MHICPTCKAQMRPLSHPLCQVCGIPFVGVGDDHLCGACLKNPPSFDVARAGFLYEGHCRELIHTFKYQNKIHLRRPLVLLVLESLSEFIVSQRPDLVLPVPLHKRRLRSRGFNQAVLLGELLAREFHLPLERRALQRVRWTEPQISLSADERRENVKGAFSVTDCAAVAGKRVMIVDDVLTTGSTVEECSRMLKRAGAAEVMVVTVARAVL